MNLYAFLLRWLPPRWAALVLTLWYAGLILLIILSWRGGSDFRYGRM